jgi:hypothetical protein
VDSVTTGVGATAASYFGGAAGVTVCSALGVTAIVSPLCAAAGAYIFGKVYGAVAPEVNWATNHLVSGAESFGKTVGHAASKAWHAAKSLCFFC